MLWWAYRPWELVCIYSVAVTPHDILYVGFLYFLVNWLHLKGQWKLYGFQGSINSVHKNQSDQSENMDHTNLSDGGEEVLSGRWRIISSTLEKDEVQIAVSLSLSKMLMEKKQNGINSAEYSHGVLHESWRHSSVSAFFRQDLPAKRNTKAVFSSRKVWILVL